MNSTLIVESELLKKVHHTVCKRRLKHSIHKDKNKQITKDAYQKADAQSLEHDPDL